MTASVQDKVKQHGDWIAIGGVTTVADSSTLQLLADDSQLLDNTDWGTLTHSPRYRNSE
jgi:hypothetical protein